MRIGIIVTYIGTLNEEGTYNDQHIGLGKALATLYEEVIVYKAISHKHSLQTKTIGNRNNCKLVALPMLGIGNNGFPNMNKVDERLDVLIYFSDTQLFTARVYKWTKEKRIQFYPYIGATKSHSDNLIKRKIVDILFLRVLRVYRKCQCFAKTPAVERQLLDFGVKNTVVIPVGLDQELLAYNFAEISVLKLKEKYGYQKDDKVILFIGRMVSEKQPLRMLDIFKKLTTIDENYRLLMVGRGELSNLVANRALELNLSDKVKRITEIPNSEMWELYRLADCYVNLNQVEIFGMAIAEAMYYGCKVIAWHAPGPELMIEEGISGWVVKNDEEVIKKILDKTDFTDMAMKRIRENFLWEKIAQKFFSILTCPK